MIKDRLSVQRDQHRGGWIVIVDGGVMQFDSQIEAVKVACSELDAYEELSAMNEDLSAETKRLTAKLEKAQEKARRLECDTENAKHELAAAKWELSATRALLEDTRKAKDEMDERLKDGSELEKFHKHFINGILTENFKLKQALANRFIKEYFA